MGISWDIGQTSDLGRMEASWAKKLGIHVDFGGISDTVGSGALAPVCDLLIGNSKREKHDDICKRHQKVP